MKPLPSLTRALLGLAACALLAAIPVSAQSPAARTPASQPTTIPALFLSDIHLNPFNDPSKAARLNAAPLAEWAAILGAPDSPTQPKDYAALQSACTVGGIDTTDALWHSSLRAIHTDTDGPSAPVKFVTISGDLLGHMFDCKFRTLLPKASHADYLAFIEKTIRYELDGLHSALPGVPIYLTLGNNDTACVDYQLAPNHDELLALTAPLVIQAMGPAAGDEASRQTILSDYQALGAYNAPLAAVPDTRILSLDDLYESVKYATCSGQPNPAPATAQLDWLEAQLAASRQHHQHVWVLGHIPPGVDLYTTARHLTNVCGGAKPATFLGSERLAEILAANSDVVRLALFGHTHDDEMRLLPADPLSVTEGSADSSPKPSGVPVKLTSSITSVNRNRPSFTLAKIDPSTATLVDYTVIMASNLTGVAATWSKEYTYSTTYHQPAFSAAALDRIITGFQADPSASSAASQAYLSNYFPGGEGSVFLQLVWPQYVCAMSHDSAQGFAACVCAKPK